jgi:hypothetical protein
MCFDFSLINNILGFCPIFSRKYVIAEPDTKLIASTFKVRKLQKVTVPITIIAIREQTVRNPSSKKSKKQQQFGAWEEWCF